MLSAASSQNDANSSSSFLTTGSSVCLASFRRKSAWPRRPSGQLCIPYTLPLREIGQSIVELSAIWLLRVGQPKGADGVEQHGECERYARARCFGDPFGRNTWVGCTIST